MTAPAPREPAPQWVQLWLWRVRTFVREPGILFWVFGFPMLLAVALGIAFRHRGPERAAVLVAAPELVEGASPELVEGASPELVEGGSPELVEGASPELVEGTHSALQASPLLAVRTLRAAETEAAYRRGEALVVVVPGNPPTVRHDPGRPGAPAAAAAAVDALERAAGRLDRLEVRRDEKPVPGRRYIDFLIPGLLGMGLLSGGIWGVGYDLVSQRVKRLLKRMAATPMSRPAFLGSFLIHRMVVATLETTFLLTFGYLAFDVAITGSIVAVGVVALSGAASFGGLGLLLGSRAQNMETANGLMNLATLPMWLLSGVFFSTANFPGWMRPVVDALPLTALNDALRAVVNDGASLVAVLPQLGVLAVWGVTCFAIALRIFRWQ